MTEPDVYTNNLELRELVDASGLTITEILRRFNAEQARPIALRTLNSYLATPPRKPECPVQIRFSRICAQFLNDAKNK